MLRRTAPIYIFSVFYSLLTINGSQAADLNKTQLLSQIAQADGPNKIKPSIKKGKPADWGIIKWKHGYLGNDICLKGTSPTGDIMADYCRYYPQYQWLFHKKDNCLENMYYGGKCLSEASNGAVLSPRNGPVKPSVERTLSSDSQASDKYYWLMEDTGENQKWCLTLDDNGDPPWDLFYRKCHEDMHAQKFVVDGTNEPTDEWARIKWRNSYLGWDICLFGTGPRGEIQADYCRYYPESPDEYFPQFEWRFHKEDNCIENRYYGGKCITEISDKVVLSPRKGPETLTNEFFRRSEPRPSDISYQLKADVGGNEKWCLTIHHIGAPPWYLYYRECHENLQSQKFVMDDKMGF